jgi:hypothetical protein
VKNGPRGHLFVYMHSPRYIVRAISFFNVAKPRLDVAVLYPQTSILNPRSSNPNPLPSALNPSTLNPKHQVLNPQPDWMSPPSSLSLEPNFHSSSRIQASKGLCDRSWRLDLPPQRLQRHGQDTSGEPWPSASKSLDAAMHPPKKRDTLFFHLRRPT